MVVIDEVLKEHQAIKMWHDAIGKYNSVVEKVKALKMGEKVPLKGIELDIKDYICEQTVLEIGRLMGEEEQRIRSDPKAATQGGTCNHPVVFVKVFNGDKLMDVDYKQVCPM